MQKSIAGTGLATEYRSVFDLSGVPAFGQFYEFGIFVWKWLWKGLYKPWHIIPAPTIADRHATREMYRLNMAKAICAEMAGLIWGEECAVNVSINGHETTKENPEDPLDCFVQSVLSDNAFREKMQESIETGCALGGNALKVWAEARHGEKGEEIPETRKVRVGYCMADQFIPLAWDNARVTEAVFISRIAKDGYYYTRLEWHKWNGETYVITNELFRAEMQKGAETESQDILGVHYPLSELFPYLEPETVVPVEESLFSYWRTPIANNLDDNSPLGMSIYGNALETLHALDICYDSFVREFRLGKKRIIVPARAVRTVIDPTTSEVVRYFDASDETYEALATDNPDELKITDNSVVLRVDEHVRAINAFLSILCLQTGFSAGTFTFDAHEGLKTATEVISENSKTYKTIKTVQNQIRPAIEHLVRNIIDVAILYKMTDENGTPVEKLAAPGYEIKVTFDDGITQDRQTNINEGVLLVGAGIISKYTFLTEPKYGIGLTEEEAQKELERIRAESPATISDSLSIFNAGG